MSEPYKMPTVELGEPVYWYPDGDKTQEPHAAVVTKVGHDTVALNILAPDTYNMRLRDGVRFIDDPRAKAPELREQGAWDYSEMGKRLRRLCNELGVKK